MPLFLSAMALLVLLGLSLPFTPDRAASELENRPLTQFPSLTGWADGSFAQHLETYAADQLPLRDTLVSARATLRALRGERLQNGVLLGRGGWLMEEPQQAPTRTGLLAAEALAALQKALDMPGYLLLIPTSAEVLAEQLPPLYQADSQQETLRALYAAAAPMQAVESGLTAYTGAEELYYRTDHHLTRFGARLCYEALGRAMSFTPGDVCSVTAEEFRGSYYARLPAWTVAAETFSADIPEGLRLTLDGREAPILDEALLTGRNKYGALLGGTYGHAVLENEAASGTLLVLADSYINAVAPSLARHFGRVEVVDPRYFSGRLAEVVRENPPDALLCVFGVNTFNTNRSLLLLDLPEGGNAE